MFSDSIKAKLKEKLSSNKTIFINYGSEKEIQDANQMIKQSLNTDRISEMTEPYVFNINIKEYRG